MRWISSKKRVKSKSVLIWILMVLFVLHWSLHLQSSELMTDPILRIDAGGHTSRIWRLALSPDGKHVISAGMDKEIRIWNLETGECENILRIPIGRGSEGKIFALSLSPDGSTLAVAGIMAVDYFSILLLDFPSGNFKHRLSYHTATVIALEFSHNGQLLASGGHDDKVALWNVSTGELIREFVGHSNSIYDLSFSPTQALLASASYDATVCVWDIDNGTIVHSLSSEDQVRSVDFSPDGTKIVSGDNSGNLLLWNVETGDLVRSMAAYSDDIYVCAFDPLGSRVLVAGKFYEMKNNKEYYPVHIYDTNSYEQIFAFYSHNSTVMDASWWKDGSRIVSVGGDQFEITYWNAVNGAVLQNVQSKGAPVEAVGWHTAYPAICMTHKDPQSFSYASQNFQHCIDYDNNITFNRPIINENIQSSLSSVGSLEVDVISDYQVNIYNNDTLVSSIEHRRSAYDKITAYSFNPDGDRIAIGSYFQLSVYNTQTGEEVNSYVGHTEEITALAFSLEGNRLMSGSLDQTIRIWDVVSGYNLISIFFTREGEWVAWNKNGYYCASEMGEEMIGWQFHTDLNSRPDFFYATEIMHPFHQEDLLSSTLQ